MQNQDYELTADPQLIAQVDAAQGETCVFTNLSATDSFELLGKGEALGHGTAVLAGGQPSLDMAYGEEVYAACAEGVTVTVRVLSVARPGG